MLAVEFENFDPGSDRVDTFYKAMETAPDYSQIWKVVKLILIFSHGEAGVERGFCVNRNVENRFSKRKPLFRELSAITSGVVE